MLERIQKTNYEKEDKILASEDRAIQNIKTGEALVNKIKSNNPNIKTTSSGLTYLIHKPGAGMVITDTDTLTLKFTVTHLDGKIIDSNDQANIIPNQVISGLKEGLKMLRKGANATFWIPGHLGYGGHGQPNLSIGPMETIVFEVQISDVKK